MIEDGFVTITTDGDIDHVDSTVRCKKCEHTFDVHLELFNEKNCKYDIGTSVTIICSKCKAEATTDLVKNKTAILERKITELRKIIDDSLKERPLIFKLENVDLESGNVDTTCLGCKHKFTLNPKKHINYFPTEESMIITCPACSICDETDKDKLNDRMNTMVAIMELRAAEMQLDAIKNNRSDDNNETDLQSILS